MLHIRELKQTSLVSKYSNKQTLVDGHKFDSQAEASRYSELKLLERAGSIFELKRQVSLKLLPGVKFDGVNRKQPALRYLADFTYLEDGSLVIEDVKSKDTVTALFKIKRHILLSLLGKQIRVHQAG